MLIRSLALVGTIFSFALTAVGGFHAYVQSSYGNAPYAITTYNPSTGTLGDFSFAAPPQAFQVLGSPGGAELWIIGLTGNNGSGFLSIYSTTQQSIVASLPLPGTGVGCFLDCPVGLFGPNGKLFYATVSGSAGTSLLMYSVSGRQLLSQTLLPGVDGVVSAAISPDGSQLFVTDRLKITVIDTETRKVAATLPIQSGLLAVSGNILLASGPNSLIYIDMSTGDQQASVVTAAVPGVISVSADGSKAALLEEYVNNETGEEAYYLQTLNVPAQSITASTTLNGNIGIILSPDGTDLTVLGSKSIRPPGLTGFSYIETWDPQTYAVLKRTRVFDEAAIPVYAGSTLYLYFYSCLMSVVDGLSQTVTAHVPIGGGGAQLAAAPGGHAAYAFTSAGLDIVLPDDVNPVPSLALTYGPGGKFSSFGLSKTQIYGVGSDSFSAINPFTGEQHALRTPGFVQPQNCFNAYGTPSISPDQGTLVLNIGVLCGAPPSGDAPSKNEAVEGIAIYSLPADKLTAQVVVNTFGPLAISPDSTIAYVSSNSYSFDEEPTQISMVDLTMATVGKVWSYAQDPFFADFAVSPDGATLYASASVNNTGAILTIDTVTGAITNQYPISANSASIALSPDGSELVISGFAGSMANSVGFMDTQTGAITFVDTGYPAGQVVVTN